MTKPRNNDRSLPQRNAFLVNFSVIFLTFVIFSFAVLGLTYVFSSPTADIILSIFWVLMSLGMACHLFFLAQDYRNTLRSDYLYPPRHQREEVLNTPIEVQLRSPLHSTAPTREPRPSQPGPQVPVTRQAIHQSTRSESASYSENMDDGWCVPGQIPLPSNTSAETDQMRPLSDSELRSELTEFQDKIAQLVGATTNHLDALDDHMVRRIHKNTANSINGILTARRIILALEKRANQIAEFLSGSTEFDRDLAIHLLEGELEFEDSAMTSLISTAPLEPLKPAEWRPKLTALLKKASRRATIFRGRKIDLPG